MLVLQTFQQEFHTVLPGLTGCASYLMTMQFKVTCANPMFRVCLRYLRHKKIQKVKNEALGLQLGFRMQKITVLIATSALLWSEAVVFKCVHE